MPYLAGERTPNWPHATGTLLGLRPGSLRPGLLYRAALEGATFGLLAGVKAMQVGLGCGFRKHRTGWGQWRHRCSNLV